MAALFLITPTLANASVDSSLKGIQTVLLSQLLPTLAGISLAFSAGAFLMGSQNAKQYLTYSIFGCIIIYAAQSIVSLISSTVR
ncbi:MAG: hypothetical protein JST16_01095 [Bdellovibrionales bacterium]|nr:hypothetical protein [Bdellovibrionales bacterium]